MDVLPPEISGGSRFTVNEMFKEINSLLPAGNTGNLINFMTVGQISLNHALMKENNITEGNDSRENSQDKSKREAFFQRCYI
jgi:hypothetical protein